MRRIIGMLNYWDESCTWLAATVASAARVCDHIVALDGRYAMFGDERVASPQEQADAIAHAAYGAGVGLTLVQPRRIYLDEMAKRTELFQHALVGADVFNDWLLVIDADEVLDPTVSQMMVHTVIDEAEAAGSPVVAGLLRETIDEHENEHRSIASRKQLVEATSLAPTPRLFQTHHDMRVQGYHFHYSGIGPAGNRVVLWNRDGDGPRAEWHMAEELVVETRCLLRSAHRAQQRVEYYAERDREKAEQVSMQHVIEGAA